MLSKGEVDHGRTERDILKSVSLANTGTALGGIAREKVANTHRSLRTNHASNLLNRFQEPFPPRLRTFSFVYIPTVSTLFQSPQNLRINPRHTTAHRLHPQGRYLLHPTDPPWEAWA